MSLTSERNLKKFSLARLRNALLKFGSRNSIDWNDTGALAHLSDASATWLQFIGRELIFYYQINGRFPSYEWQNFAENYGPAEGLSFAECAATRASFSLFPLDTGRRESNQPELVQIMLVPQKLDQSIADDRQQLTKSQDRLSNDYCIYLLSSDSKNFDGDSWQLAYNLAVEALVNMNSKFTQELATEWIATGAIRNESVNRVLLGNKLELHSENNPRKWLIPSTSAKEIPEGYEGAEIHLVGDVNQTVMHISGDGTKRRENQQWPENIDEHHLLIGGNIKAQIASILICNCSKVVLWHSENKENSQIPTQYIKEIVEKELGIQCELQQISTSNIVESEEKLRHYFHEHSSEKILFNVTSGTRLMSFAVQSIARLYPNIELIYREQGDEAHHRFKVLSYEQFPPYSGEIIGSLPEGVSIDNSFLYGKSQYSDSEDFIEKLHYNKNSL